MGHNNFRTVNLLYINRKLNCIINFFRVKYLEATLFLAGMSEGSNCTTQHKDLKHGEILRSEKNVTDCMAAINNFVNPFEIEDKEGLYNISSGSNVPIDIEKDLLRA